MHKTTSGTGTPPPGQSRPQSVRSALPPASVLSLGSLTSLIKDSVVAGIKEGLALDDDRASGARKRTASELLPPAGQECGRP